MTDVNLWAVALATVLAFLLGGAYYTGLGHHLARARGGARRAGVASAAGG